jgi:S1-C subfamily serine protease
LTRLLVVTMETYEKDAESVGAEKIRGRAHYALVVPAQKKPEKPAEAAEAPVLQDTTGAAPADPGARAALGIMPDYGATGSSGVVIADVTAGGAAEKAGLLGADRIVRIGGEAIADLEDYMSVLGEKKAGEVVAVVVVRGGTEKTFDVRLQASQRR